jgi:hypothetical protein
MKELFVLLAGMVCEILRVLVREMRVFLGRNDVWNNWDSGRVDGLVSMSIKNKLLLFKYS